MSTEAHDLVEEFDEVVFEQTARVNSYFTGSRFLVAASAMLQGGMVFAFFYLRSVNSSGLWRLPHQNPSIILGSLVAVAAIAAAGISLGGLSRLRKNSRIDWQVSTGIALLLELFATGMQIWQLTRIGFFPGSSGYASVYVGWAIVNVAFLLGCAYWVETLFARSLRVGLETGNDSDSDPTFTAAVEAASFFLNFMAIVEVLIFVLFYIVK